jgi:hypothetical protein
MADFKESHRGAYSESVTTPRTPLDWQLALADPLSKIGRDYNSLISNANADKRELNKFLEQLVLVTFNEQQRVKEQILRNIENDDNQAKSRVLQSWAKAQLTALPEEKMTPEISSLMQDINNLLLQAARLAQGFAVFATEQQALHKKWYDSYQQRSRQFIDKLNKKKLSFVTAEGDDVILTPIKEAEIMGALMPVAPALIARVNPGLAEKIHELELAGKTAVYDVMSQVTDLTQELCLNALATNDGKLLTGPSLLAAIKMNRGMVNTYLFAADEHTAANHLIIRSDFALSREMEANTKSQGQVEREIKLKTQEFNRRAQNELLTASPKPAPTSKKKRNLQEESEEEITRRNNSRRTP